VLTIGKAIKCLETHISTATAAMSEETERAFGTLAVAFETISNALLPTYSVKLSRSRSQQSCLGIDIVCGHSESSSEFSGGAFGFFFAIWDRTR